MVTEMVTVIGPAVPVIVPLPAFGPACSRVLNVIVCPGASVWPPVQVTVPLPAGQPTEPSGTLPGPTVLILSGRFNVNVGTSVGAVPLFVMLMFISSGGPLVVMATVLGAFADSFGVPGPPGTENVGAGLLLLPAAVVPA